MSFGMVLRDILTVGGIKQSQLANELGYDVSYINRWIKKGQVPSLSKNPNLLENISQAIYKLSGTSGKQRICSYIEISADSTKEIYVKEIFNKLYTEYEIELSVSDNKYVKNAYASKLSSDFSGRSVLFNSLIASVNKPTTHVVEIIVCPTQDFLGEYDCWKFWRNVNTAAGNSKRIKLSLIVDFSAFSAFDICRDLYIYLTALPENFETEVYLYTTDNSNPNLFWLCKNSIFCTSLRTPISKEDTIIIIDDTSLIDQYYNDVTMYFQLQKPLFKKMYRQQLIDINYFHSFFSDSLIYGFYMSMPSIGASADLLADIANKNGIGYSDLEIELVKNCYNNHYNMFVFYSAFSKFIFEGSITVGNKIVFLDIPDRIEFLKNLMTAIRAGKINYTIINDINPVLSPDILGGNLLLNSNSICFSPNEMRNDSILQISSNKSVVSSFKLFFDELSDKINNYSINGDEVLSMIENQLDYLEKIQIKQKDMGQDINQ